MDRRKFIKVAGATVATTLISLGLQNAVVKEDSIKFIPGAGRSLDKDKLEKIDKDAFISLCARCGVCSEVCPFKAIKFQGLAFPQLTDATRQKCPGYDFCGYCGANCPTDAIDEAYDNVGIIRGSERKKWWQKPEPVDI